MRKLLVAVLAAALLGAIAVQASGADRRTIRVGDNWFVTDGSPRTVTVKQDTRVVWRFTGNRRHNVTVTDGPSEFGSDNQSGGTYSKKMKRRGTYDIVCTLHASTMQMTLRVKR